MATKMKWIVSFFPKLFTAAVTRAVDDLAVLAPDTNPAEAFEN